MTFHTIQDAKAAWAADSLTLEQLGVVFPDVVSYTTEPMKRDFTLAMDALPTLSTSANSGIPAFLTTMVDPQVFKILFSPTNAAKILGEVRKGSWTDQTAMFPVVEHTGEVSSYGDHSENGHTGANTAFPQRQSYLYQTIVEYGELELERAGLAKINYVSELDAAAATTMNRFQNLTYFKGVSGLQNYGLLNDPNLSASLSPATKASPATGNTWFNSGAPNCTANEVYNDILALYTALVAQTGGLVDAETPMVLAMSPGSEAALSFTNSFGLTARDILQKNYPNIKIVTAVQYAVLSASNPQGVAGGNLMQLIATSVEGQETGYCAFNEKMRSHPIIRQLSSFRQKRTGGTWGAIIRQPFAIVSMLGI
ncbi:hypothetical protein [Xanthobacter sp. ZOL 2024]